MSEIVAGSVFPSSKITAESITTVPCILLPAAADEVTLLACAETFVIPILATKNHDATIATEF
jgi:hypothetical protein